MQPTASRPPAAARSACFLQGRTSRQPEVEPPAANGMAAGAGFSPPASTCCHGGTADGPSPRAGPGRRGG